MGMPWSEWQELRLALEASGAEVTGAAVADGGGYIQYRRQLAEGPRTYRIRISDVTSLPKRTRVKAQPVKP